MANNTGIKYGGRQKGTANKATARLREAFTELLEGVSILSLKPRYVLLAVQSSLAALALP